MPEVLYTVIGIILVFYVIIGAIIYGDIHDSNYDGWNWKQWLVMLAVGGPMVWVVMIGQGIYELVKIIMKKLN